MKQQLFALRRERGVIVLVDLNLIKFTGIVKVGLMLLLYFSHGFVYIFIT